MPRSERARRREDAGFSLVELVIVSGILSCLGALAVPAYTGALDRARVTRAIGDISAVEKEILVFQIGSNCLPGSLADIGRDTLTDPWGHPYGYAVPKDNGQGQNGGSCAACNNACVPPGQARKDHNLVPINSDYDLFSKGKDGQSSPPLTAKASEDDVIRGRDGGFIGLASTY